MKTFFADFVGFVKRNAFWLLVLLGVLTAALFAILYFNEGASRSDYNVF